MLDVLTKAEDTRISLIAVSTKMNKFEIIGQVGISVNREVPCLFEALSTLACESLFITATTVTRQHVIFKMSFRFVPFVAQLAS